MQGENLITEVYGRTGKSRKMSLLFALASVASMKENLPLALLMAVFAIVDVVLALKRERFKMYENGIGWGKIFVSWDEIKKMEVKGDELILNTPLGKLRLPAEVQPIIESLRVRYERKADS
jgi:uncharacterized membrane protein YobD (UPF0266 family)